MRFLSSLPHKRIAWAVFYLFLGILLGYFFIRYLLTIFLPFLIAFITALSLRRSSLRVAKGKESIARIVRVFMVILLLSAILFLLIFAVTAAIRQLGDFISDFSEESEIYTDLGKMLDKMSLFLAELPFFSGEDALTMRENLLSVLTDFLKNTVMSLAARLPEWIGALVSAVPKFLLFFAVTVISAIYFCLDLEKITSFFHNRLQGNTKKIVSVISGECGHAVLKYIKAYLVLFFFTFAELFIGFALLKERYAFLLALFTALVDVLPVLGTGTVLVPWALWLFLTGHTAGAVGLLVLYVVIALVRQVMEPKILGAGMGVSPLLTLIAIYAGLKLFGFWGMILMPPLVMIVKNSLHAIAPMIREETA